jgi:dTMP kinase
VFLDPPDEVVAARMRGRDLDRFEAAGDDFHRRVIDGFRTMAADPRWITIDAVGTIEEVGAAIDVALDDALAVRLRQGIR